ncbi:MAG TPA: hypothetical protein VK489_04330, partial [Ferruginibacter sp.]|nr:hypothetical protein [Ferruginibacter sp.]
MISAILFVMAFLLSGLALGVFKKQTYVNENNRFRIAGIIRAISAFFIALVVVVINPVDIERIDAGHVGIKVSNVGDNRGVGRTEYVTGWVLYNSWISRIYEFPIHQQHIDYEAADIVTRGGFRATIKPSFN